MKTQPPTAYQLSDRLTRPEVNRKEGRNEGRLNLLHNRTSPPHLLSPPLSPLCPFPAIHCSSLAQSGQCCCQSDWWAVASAVRSEQDHQGKIMQSEILAEWSWQAMDPPAAPAAFKGILSKRGKESVSSGGAAVHHLLRGTGLKKQRGGRLLSTTRGETHLVQV